MTITAKAISTRHQAAAHLATLVAVRLAPTLTAITREASVLDGFGSTASGAAKEPGGTSDSSSTERAALGRLEGSPGNVAPTALLHELDDLVRCYENVMNLILKFSDDHAGTLTAIDRQRMLCVGGPGCTSQRIADPTRRDGLCLECGVTVDVRRRAEADKRRLRRHQTIPDNIAS
jgi:hypothetical protein